MSVIRVVVADAYECGRTAVAAQIRTHRDLELVAAVATLADVFALLHSQRVDSVIAERDGVEYPPMLLLDLLAQHAPDTRVIFRTGTTDRVGDLLRAGARGYVDKRDPLHLVGAAIQAVHAGRMYVSPHALADLSSSDRLMYEYQFTRRDLAVLHLLTGGFTTRGIAQELSTSEQEIATHIGQLLHRTQTDTRIQLADWYRQRFLVSARENHGPSSLRDDYPEQLSCREVAVLELVRRDYTNQQIADTLAIGTGTVRWHVSNILTKLGAPNRRQAVQMARQRGMLTQWSGRAGGK